jgi:hypothetical protein
MAEKLEVEHKRLERERRRAAEFAAGEMLGMTMAKASRTLANLSRRLRSTTGEFRTRHTGGKAKNGLAMGRSQFFYKRSRFFQLVEWDVQLEWLTRRLQEQGRCIRVRQVEEVKENRRLIKQLNKRVWQCPRP